MNAVKFNPEKRVVQLLHILREASSSMERPAVAQIVDEFGRDPFLILISCLLSLRTRDSISLPISRQLFSVARTPYELVKIPVAKLEKMLYSIGFYRRKARQLIWVSQELINRFKGSVPSTEEELLAIKGIGRKTANIVLAEAFNIPAIAVDTHVHRIANRLGLVKTKTPEETEKELKKVVPERYWNEINPLLVMWGQNVCTPLIPKCSMCSLLKFCPRIGVVKSR